MAVCAALWLAQLLALAHGIAHPHAATAHAQGHGHAHDHDHDHDHEHDHAEADARRAGGSLAALFDADHDEGSVQCQLLDQVAHADALSTPLVAWTFAPPVADFAANAPAPQRATVGRGYHARGPPAFLA